MEFLRFYLLFCLSAFYRPALQKTNDGVALNFCAMARQSQKYLLFHTQEWSVLACLPEFFSTIPAFASKWRKLPRVPQTPSSLDTRETSDASISGSAPKGEKTIPPSSRANPISFVRFSRRVPRKRTRYGSTIHQNPSLSVRAGEEERIRKARHVVHAFANVTSARPREDIDASVELYVALKGGESFAAARS